MIPWRAWWWMKQPSKHDCEQWRVMQPCPTNAPLQLNEHYHWSLFNLLYTFYLLVFFFINHHNSILPIQFTKLSIRMIRSLQQWPCVKKTLEFFFCNFFVALLPTILWIANVVDQKLQICLLHDLQDRYGIFEVTLSRGNIQ